MKWGIYYSGILVFMIFVLFACNKARGPIVEEEVSVAFFSGIEHELRDNVFINYGPTQRVKIEAQSNVIEALSKKVENGIWKIYFPDKPKLYKNMKITITTPDLKYIGLNGPGIILSKSMMNFDSLKLSISGSGNIDIDANIQKLHTKVLGNGDIFLKGTAATHLIDIESTGRVNSFEMESNEAEIMIPGSGTANVKVKDFMKARITGNGSINYMGNPTIDAITSDAASITKVD